MKRYIGKRLLTAVLCVLLALLLNFMIIHAAPGDPIRILAGSDHVSPDMVAQLTQKYGLDKPLYVQFLRYVGNLLHGDMGVSIYTNQPVAQEIMEKLGPTLMLCLTSCTIALIIGTLIGIFCARHVGSKLDTFLGSISYFFDSTPSFWLGLMLILVFASWLHLLPTSGMISLRAPATGFGHVLDVLKHLILPGAALSLTLIPYYFRIARTSVIQVGNEDFITTLRAAGMSEQRIYRKYVFRNAILPVVTVFGIQLAYIVSGSAIVEIVFSWPGMGSYMMTAISRRDYPTLMGIYFVISISVAIMMIAVDVVYTYLDPRISRDGAK
ncbi:MAG: ABC transporter permease [Firmicutes bacterium]|nr:ABC transporter permease [Bacillota bacterium]MBQ6663762.1 ABC transporter permease [Bacillota bacterium]